LKTITTPADFSRRVCKASDELKQLGLSIVSVRSYPLGKRLRVLLFQFQGVSAPKMHAKITQAGGERTIAFASDGFAQS
jgi:hypothetical protein